MSIAPTVSNEVRQGLLSIEPGADGAFGHLIDFVSAERQRLDLDLLTHGALLFRGWAIRSLEDFSRFVIAFSGGEHFFDYAGGASPRAALGGEKSGLYSSTEYPPHVSLSLHNELSYASLYPRRLFFFCVTPPEEGGETTYGDSRRILAALDPELVGRFRSKQVRYIRNLSPEAGSGYSWQEAFAEADPRAVEDRCRAIGAGFEWKDGFLSMSQTRPATAIHPETGEELWFNQADGFHPTALDPGSYEAALAQAGTEDRFRLGVSYGDGTAIELETLAHVRAVIEAETIPHRWRAGDVLVLDNLLSAHGRRPFSGARKIALAMT